VSVAAAFLVAIGSAAGADVGEPLPPWRVWTAPVALATHRDDYSVVQQSSASADPCAYDASGQVLPGSLACRYDHLFRPSGRHRYLREEGKELVLVDERGPGAIVRVWMTTGNGFSADFPPDLRLKVRLDGNPIPAVDLPVSQWFDGSTWPFTWPLAGNRSNAAGASFSYVPIVFSEGATVSLSGPDASIDARPIWYHFDVQRHAAASSITSGIPGDIGDWFAFSRGSPGGYPWPRLMAWQIGSAQVEQGTTQTLFERDGGDTLLAFRVRTADIAHLETVTLQIEFDGDRRIDQRLNELFAFSGSRPDAQEALLYGIGNDYAYLYLPMPFHQSMRLQLSQPSGAGDAQVDYDYAFAGMPPPADAMRLAAHSHDTCIDGGRDAPDLTLLDVSGRGRWMSLATRQGNQPPADPNYLEGDERIYVDGSRHPAWQGTGNEDLYNGGFYFDRGGSYGFAHAYRFAGAPGHAFNGPVPSISNMYRLLMTDAVPFHSHLRVDLERGAYGDQPMCSRGVAFLYVEPERALAPVASLDLGDPASVAAAHYVSTPVASCKEETFSYAEEPPRPLAGTVCRRVGGASNFMFTLRQPASRLWLRRRLDGAEGGQAARVEVEGVAVAHLPYAMATPDRRWQDVDLPLDLPPQPAGATLAFRVVPDDAGAVFTESAYELIATAHDELFAHGFESNTAR
jgi:hypothetical protein